MKNRRLRNTTLDQTCSLHYYRRRISKLTLNQTNLECETLNRVNDLVTSTEGKKRKKRRDLTVLNFKKTYLGVFVFRNILRNIYR